METLYKITTGIATGAMIVFLALWLITGCQNKKQVSELTARIKACESAPVKVRDSIIHDIVTQKIYIKVPVSSSPDTVFVPDTTKAKLCEGTFSSTYKYVKGSDVGRISYEITVKDCQPWIRFPEIDLPRHYITETKTVDTCLLKPPQYMPKNHFALYGGLGANNLHEFPLVNAGILWSIKDRIGLMPGITYDPLQSKLYGSANIVIYLK